MIDADGLAAALRDWPLQDIPALPGRRNHRRAGVLLPLVWRDDRLLAVATLRARRLREHAGEVSFPGGKREDGDADLTQTALREAHEEIGLHPDRVRVLGHLSAMPLYTSDYRLVPTVAAFADGPLLPEPGEVAKILTLDVGAMLAADALDALPWDWDGVLHHSPVFPVGGHILYGGTAHSLHELLQVIALARGQALPPWRTGRYRWAHPGVVPAN